MAKKKAAKRGAKTPKRAARKPAPREASPVRGLLPPAREPDEIPRQEAKFDFGFDPAKANEAVKALREKVKRLVQRGVADKIRISYKGKPVAPDIPVAYFLAAEAVAFWATGFLQILLVNIGAKAVLTVELISSAAEHHAKGLEKYLAGDLGAARSFFEKAVESDDYHAPSHRMLGTILKIQGDRDGAKKHLKRAIELDPDGEDGKQARNLLSELA